ncbi:1-(5-phosphoribosyl)-5-[(5-phosphoribosylamino)methylideneamino]imidazole-4-carboxamide isomerase [Pelosinus propionicus]|uniref:1-(5-phosphoribosyl)-5-[(5-phosphoribosylamino)methylideneamino] imidazole-4-carboxamide isomerase n=1 Tax=Pelosinus propionicus DSM 13327 TaxID=1123291 RepID=A0A1I4KKX5_9FIRM|nr:1-(5-phosphoribosyl)-5-[(5-phosphoribosylamino)methylideneamino]imidazole-4-carboxamide isomerase [Pelosinus propionicus]SFL79414.1 1-(5-phosphoribosyl)-5-[(5-phosphoribosylamino)methylideneamino] imidazole-4-carboxamide isomerase [Pelosinus propionicus DSM 13327]
MIVFPAIDIRNGKCVRLTEGRFDKETIFADNPLDMAVQWVNQGAEYLHLVDLDGALAGRPVNLDVIANIIKNVRIPVQLGGGIRNLDTIAQFLEVGVARVILGSVAVKQPDLVAAACEKYGDRIVVGIDARGGMVAVEGWGITGGIEAEQLARKMAQVGVARIIYTDISRDGTLSGVNIPGTAALAKSSGIPVIASGGVRDLSDIEEIKKAASDGIEGVIVGKAIYTGSLKLADALRLLRGE